MALKSESFIIILLVAFLFCFFTIKEEPVKEPPATCEETTEETTTEPVMQEFIVTAYCPCEKCCGKWAKDRKGAVRGCKGDLLESGKTIAVDFETIPYGSVVVLEGKEYKALDCGGKIKGNHIDIYFDTHEEAVQFGKKAMKGYVKND